MAKWDTFSHHTICFLFCLHFGTAEHNSATAAQHVPPVGTPYMALSWRSETPRERERVASASCSLTQTKLSLPIASDRRFSRHKHATNVGTPH